MISTKLGNKKKKLSPFWFKAVVRILPKVQGCERQKAKLM